MMKCLIFSSKTSVSVHRLSVGYVIAIAQPPWQIQQCLRTVKVLWYGIGNGNAYFTV